MTGCRVFDDFRPCVAGLYLDEHRLVDGEWLHPLAFDDQDPTDTESEDEG